VITAKKKNVIRINHKEGEEESYNFNGIFPSINIITKKEKSGIRRGTGVNENAKQVKDVPVNVTNNVEGRVKIHDDLGALENLFRTIKNLDDEIRIECGDGNGAADFFAVHAIEIEERAECLKNKRGGLAGIAHLEGRGLKKWDGD
jgi:hypothetical protein